MHRGLVCAVAVAVGSALSLSGCGDDDEAAAVVEITFTEPSAGRVAINAPSSIEGGVVELKVTNSGQGLHSVQLIRVTGTHTQADLLAFLESEEEGGPIPDWFHDGGGLGTVPPGQTASATLKLKEGKHFLWDDESVEEDGPSWASRGGIVEINVTSGGGGSLPDADATITAKEYQFDTKGFKAGSNTFRFENDGKQFHHVIAAPMLPGKTLDDVRAFFETEGEPTGPPPLDFESGVGTAVFEGGNGVVTTWELQAGNYALVCFISDKTGGPPHFTMGMLKQLTVA